MINKVSAANIKPIFISVAQAKGYTHDFENDPKVQQNHQIDQANRGKTKVQRIPTIPYDGKGFMAYQSGMFELWNEFGGRKLVVVARGNEVSINADKDTEEIADVLASEIDKQIPNLQVNVKIV